MNTKNHIIHYVPLYVILALGLLGMVGYQYNNDMQRAVIVATAAGYFMWGMVHHKIHEELSFEIFLEYLFVAFIGSALLFSVV